MPHFYDDSEDQALEDAWSFLDEYDNGEWGCPKCGRMRLCLCPNGMHRCEKCNWSPELNDYSPIRD